MLSPPLPPQEEADQVARAGPQPKRTGRCFQTHRLPLLRWMALAILMLPIDWTSPATGQETQPIGAPEGTRSQPQGDGVVPSGPPSEGPTTTPPMPGDAKQLDQGQRDAEQRDAEQRDAGQREDRSDYRSPGAGSNAEGASPATASAADFGDLPPVLADQAIVPDAVYLLDQRGNRVLVPNFSFERWEQLERAIKGGRTNVGGALAPVAILSSQLRIEVRDAWAEFRWKLRARLSPSRVANGADPSSREVLTYPLRMDNLFQLESLNVSGLDEGRCELSADGYRLRVPPSTVEREFEVEGRFVGRVESVGNASQLAVRLPIAATNVELVVQRPNQNGYVSGRGNEVLERLTTDPTSTTFALQSNGGDFTIIWQDGAAGLEPGQLLDVTTNWTIEWTDPAGRPKASLQLALEDQLRELKSFDLRLPRDAVLQPSSLEGQAWVAESIASSDDGLPQWRFRRTGDDAGPATGNVQLELQLSPQLDDQGVGRLVLDGFDVVGSSRHRGQINVRTALNYQLRWVHSAAVRAPERSEAQTFRFNYDSTPLGLALRLVADQRELRLQPKHVLTIGTRTAELETTLEGIVATNVSGTVEVVLPGWTLRRVSAEDEAKDIASYFEYEQDTVRLDLAALTGGERRETGRFAITIRAERALEQDTSAVQIPLPIVRQVRGDAGRLPSGMPPVFVSVAPHLLSIVPEAGLQVIPDAKQIERDQLVALEKDRLSSEVPSGAQSVFRVPTTAATTFAGLIRPEQLRGAMEQTVSVRVDDERSSVNQQIELQIDEGLISGPQFIVRGGGELASAWSVKVNGRTVFHDVRKDESMNEVVLSIPGEQLARGRHALTLQWDGPPLGAVSSQWQGAVLPYALLRGEPTIPAVTKPLGLTTTDAWEARFNLGDERRISDEEDASTALLRRGTALEYRVADQDQNGAAVVDRVWLQTVVGRGQRRDRLILRTSAETQRLQLMLEDWPAETPIRVIVDDVVVREGTYDQGPLRIELPPLSSERIEDDGHLVEIWGWVAEPAGSSIWWQRVRPRIGGLLGVRQFYWQLVLPPDQHVLWTPASLGQSMTWQWRTLSIQRQPTMDDRSLAEWIGCRLEPSVPWGARYLYATVSTSDLRAVCVSRTTLWLFVAIPMLLVAVLVIYADVLRRPWWWLVLGVMIAGAASVAPDSALLLGQWGIIAMLPLVLAVGLRRLWEGPTATSLLPSARRGSRSDVVVPPASRSGDPIGVGGEIVAAGSGEAIP
jgi:hypothetical protein